jgi:anaphase-promoting complex subunit 10
LAGGVYEHGEISEEELMEDIGEGDDELLGDAVTEDLGDEMSDGNGEDHSGNEMDHDPFNPTDLGLKEINNLAHFGVSSHRPGNGVAELLSDDLDKYWQYVSPFLPNFPKVCLFTGGD